MSGAADFRLVKRGYDPEQVASRVRGLEAEIARLRADVPLRDAPEPDEPATYEHLGERMLQILALAREEAEELRRAVRAELDAERARVADDLDRHRERAELEAEQIRADATAAAAAIIDGARMSAADLLESADVESAARRAEAELVMEQHHEQIAAATAEFERAFRETEAQHRARLDALEQRRVEQHAVLEDELAWSRAESLRILEQAQAKAAGLVAAAQADAEALRSDAAREMEAADRRRDGLTSELTELRSMLSSLHTMSATRPDSSAS